MQMIKLYMKQDPKGSTNKNSADSSENLQSLDDDSEMDIHIVIFSYIYYNMVKYYDTTLYYDIICQTCLIFYNSG